MDVLAERLSANRVGSTVLARTFFRGPWAATFSGPTASFHVVTRGSLWLLRPGAAPLALGRGDAVLLPTAQPHALATSPTLPAPPFVPPADPWPDEPGDAPFGLLCGGFETVADADPILALLPPLVHVPAPQVPTSCPLQAVLDVLTAEAERPGPGHRVLVEHLVDAVLVLLLRVWAQTQPEGRAGWLGAVRDEAVARVIHAVHARPEAPWTVDAMARCANLSRAPLARRFRAAVGEAPMAYVTRLRMQRARRLLRDTDAPLAEVAARVGYGSAFAFSKAFRRDAGVPPSDWRPRSRPAEAGAP